jgi:hypothetical protein
MSGMKGEPGREVVAGPMEGEEVVIFYYREKLIILDEPIVTRKANSTEVMKLKGFAA